ncbi:MAG: hypothetical protein JXD23_01145 [Spirochaetales bacterium]|nr:hypothetical protein [Spirochaetales bacterium]
MNKSGLLIAVLLCAAGAAVFGQAKSGLTDQFSFFWDVNTGDATENKNYTNIITRSALIGFQQKGFKPVPSGAMGDVVPEIDRTQPLSQTVIPRLAAMAKDQGSSFVVLVSYTGGQSGTVFELRAWDLSGKVFYEFQERVRSGLELYNRLNDATAQLISRAGAVAKSSPEGTEPAGERTAKGYVQRIVVLSGDEGAEIWVNGVVRVGVITDGRLELPFQRLNLGSKFTVVQRKPGYYDDTEEFILDREWMELPLRPLERKVEHELTFVYTVGQFVGFGAGYSFYAIPRQLYFGAENYFFLQLSDTMGSHTVFHDDLRALVGLYLISVPGMAFKVGISTGVGCIFTMIAMPDSPLYTDIYFNVININVEFRLWEVTFFVREEMKLGLAVTNNLLGGGFYFIRGEIPIFSFGARIGL